LSSTRDLLAGIEHSTQGTIGAAGHRYHFTTAVLATAVSPVWTPDTAATPSEPAERQVVPPPQGLQPPALDKVMLGELIDLISGIAMGEPAFAGLCALPIAPRPDPTEKATPPTSKAP